MRIQDDHHAMLRAPNGTPIIGIVGWKKSGKTTLTVRLVEEFVKRGLKLATVKHAHHAFDVDNGETDSARHRRAGASQVAVVSGRRWAMVTELRGAPEPNFEEIIAALEPADLIIVEGYKSAPIAKIEARRVKSLTTKPLADDDPLVIGIATDHAIDGKGLPVFDLDDIEAIADLIERILGPLPRQANSESSAGAQMQDPE
ncbi:Molybdopterin-guanine dinucleotide biosynthesis protein MobB [Candidatus Filomicrobium marinum]|uniref:Molybdopterin-guanine dinucleotide biosynthesis protein MobB n=2 Tax=Hyphomicrobiaceae TaxID=45401 RepID=A0A0D6JEX4_9HYPH|nr:Molybdopterin-guanine dinucleotide biosynthesis protein MobB [Candidatus Filomicrobium marinum]CPR18245.1 Molybdopterin-guanine dinucleotide biosynthesis protein MobB [Candidatus Filomicrobium marinum]